MEGQFCLSDEDTLVIPDSRPCSAFSRGAGRRSGYGRGGVVAAPPSGEGAGCQRTSIKLLVTLSEGQYVLDVEPAGCQGP